MFGKKHPTNTIKTIQTHRKLETNNFWKHWKTQTIKTKQKHPIFVFCKRLVRRFRAASTWTWHWPNMDLTLTQHGPNQKIQTHRDPTCLEQRTHDKHNQKTQTHRKIETFSCPKNIRQNNETAAHIHVRKFGTWKPVHGDKILTVA